MPILKENVGETLKLQLLMEMTMSNKGFFAESEIIDINKEMDGEQKEEVCVDAHPEVFYL